MHEARNHVNIPKQSHGSLAQLAEQLTLNQWVWGSNPQGSTIANKLEFRAFFLYMGLVLVVLSSSKKWKDRRYLFSPDVFGYMGLSQFKKLLKLEWVRLSYPFFYEIEGRCRISVIVK